MFSNGNCVSFQGTLLFFPLFRYPWFNCFKFVFIFLCNWAHEYVWSLGSNRVGADYLYPWSVLPEHYSILLHPGVGRLNVKNFPVQQPENRGNLKTTGKQNYKILYLQTELQSFISVFPLPKLFQFTQKYHLICWVRSITYTITAPYEYYLLAWNKLAT